ncbi:MAG TPA: tRNA (N(6)-L-threonylcarbamoyladenosine(37)-C(2))-methylthiotransferase MtaB [Bacteroidia bacterium]|jgi:threonylcarbamoyladenosine tRNA methylthiotransferase MtaB|nr:tRNA (N(6)-L-threonylcarbamoyladenosine(37)-C(2))-methylthiotransferase MtaB [Bacteroidota bacterium]MBP9789128.1 tRNA (N(6)-L-threonylcarbamoyladenosine(37)-C(2))-methylthiotransferase MtaB [Bacteroidia bacterium]MBK8586282.1 tRNA (N(6)-L-threonylcarbamoyladenosine(37)-C(2))-methylthiotransferase MtaB [Bacteroidota bacterium]MBP9922443.1 tRNA (N(6)-L-threonylcarbamoyladenosine(37)-C(2))-methylthiotransferase MtaB [Bacteroidia bacterium]HQV99001.1 tRNA (N(6)-L-threonylcarbamoyladenosine(37)-
MNSGATVSFHTLGCKLNFAETSTIARQLKNAGFQKVEFEDGADVVVINTCSVTENADKECKTIVRRAQQANPESFIAIIGCYAQLKPEEISSIDGVDLVLGATEKFNLPHYLNDLSKKELAEIHSCEIIEATSFTSAYSFGDRTRAFLKVQDGCDYSCSYCTIPLARGNSRSDTIDNVVKNAYAIAEKQVKEIVLTGVNIGDYGIFDTKSMKHESDFLSLVKRLDDVEGIERFRISSIEPNLLTDEIISFVSTSKRFVPHFHIPLQSGSDKVLALMRRRYKRNLYVERVNRIKAVMPDACIGVDVIVGFPGETEEDFMDTFRFLNELNISYLHVFTYSERENTDAALMPGVVPIQERKRRNKMLRILSEKKKNLFYSEYLNNEYTVLMEEENKDGHLSGFTSNYIRVNIPYDPAFVNQLVRVKLESFNGGLSVNSEFLEVVEENKYHSN